jgi:ABC-type nitrate/sulfonate/bicarbonate transport system substrate-binding protein
MAQELGLFAARGLQVELSREVGWATVRDKMVFGELEAAHAPAAMVLGISLGLGSFKVPCLTGLVLNLHGNAITLSNRLWEAGVRDASSLRHFVESKGCTNPLTFGVAFSCSSHHFLLQTWLRSSGIDLARQVNIVVVPPPQMPANLKAGYLDGYCVGEPWNSLAVVQKAGCVVVFSSAIVPRHAEKVFLVRADYAEACADEHHRLIAALHEACEFCQRRENREPVIEKLTAPGYLNISKEAIERSLLGPFQFHKDRVEPITDLQVFSGPDVNEPGMDKAVWVRESLLSVGILTQSLSLDRAQLAAMFRGDIFHTATGIENLRSPVLLS